MKFKYGNLNSTWFIILLCILYCTNYKTQTDAENHRKYWYFKSHFNNDFIKVGLGAGESFPFNDRSSIQMMKDYIQTINGKKVNLGSGISFANYTLKITN